MVALKQFSARKGTLSHIYYDNGRREIQKLQHLHFSTTLKTQFLTTVLKPLPYGITFCPEHLTLAEYGKLVSAP